MWFATPPARAAEPDLSWLLGILTSTAEGNWVRVNLNAFSDVWTPADLRPLYGPTNSTPYKIIQAWSSYAWDSNRGDLIIYGGGHANYSGNDVYRWRGTTGLWERASLPSEIKQDGRGNWTAIDGPDAAPASAHTYDNNIFLPIADRFVTFGGAAFNNGGEYFRQVDATTSRRTGPYFFDPSKADPNKVGGTTGSHVQRVEPHPEIVGGDMWENRDIYLHIPGSPTLPGSHVSGVTAYAQENGKDVVYIGATLGFGGTDMEIYRYVVNDINDPTADTCEWVGLYWGRTGNQGAGAYDPFQKVFLALGDNAVPFWYHDLNTPGPTNKDVGVVPVDPGAAFATALIANVIGNFGMDFDPVRRKYVLWGGGGTVWTLTPPPTVTPAGWTISKQPVPASAIPSTDIGLGVLGKWKYIPNLDAFLALQDPVNGSIWIYKPIGWRNPAALQFAVYRPSTGAYFVDYNFDHVTDLKRIFGAPGDIGGAGRIDGDGLTDFVVYRGGIWTADTNRDGTPDFVTGFGGVPGDIPLLADFNGDGRDDLVIYRTGVWFVSTAQNGIASQIYGFGGVPGDIPLSGDVSGDGIPDLVIYRSGLWYISTQRNGVADRAVGFGGAPGDIPQLFDWDGDGKADLCIFRNGVWYVNTQFNGTLQAMFGYGAAGDVPLTGRFN